MDTKRLNIGLSIVAIVMFLAVLPWESIATAGFRGTEANNCYHAQTLAPNGLMSYYIKCY